MSEPMLISPMLDNFAMGDPISCHDGVKCCPALERQTDRKCIVKVISIPASQVQLDALLLTGAYSSVENAKAYFKELSELVADEAAILQKLAALEGFTAYENWQIVPMMHETGYDVYLLGEYRRTVEQHFRRNPVTHLEAVNLGLDICAALAVCRHSGYLYVDLKPGNICINENKSYRIFDLGFVHLDGLKFASLPARYFSKYTAPEIKDAFSSLNPTIDIYAAGLILYQAYNGGHLPFTGDRAPEEVFAPPAYADYEIAEIILKACAPDPKDRWQDPVQMGQAIVSYMQRNGANDVPIVPAPAPEELFATPSPAEITENDAVDDSPAVESVDEIDTNGQQVSLFDDDASLDEVPPMEADAVSCTEVMTSAEGTEKDASDLPLVLDEASDNAPLVEETAEPEVNDTLEPAVVEDDCAFADAAEAPVPEAQITIPDTTSESDELEEETIDLDGTQDSEIIADFEEQIDLEDSSDDETAPNSDTDADYTEVSQEVSDILSYADELISHPVPEPVTAPDPIEVPIPDPLPIEDDTPEPSEEDDPDVEHISSFIPSNNSADDFPTPVELPTEASDVDDEESVTRNSSIKKWITATICLILVAALAFLGFYYYQNYYLQPISINATGNEDSLVVYVTSGINEEKLIVYCADTYGNSLTSPVVDGKAEFSNLVPGSGYTISVEVNGFHRLTGNTATAYSTPVQTNIVQFNAIAGPEDGSVILSFAIDGPDSQQWSVRYTTEGETSKIQPFSGHMVTVVGLTIGKEYTFTLESENAVYITGNKQLIWTAEKNIKAVDLEITGCDSNKLTANWSIPDGVTVDNWSVRCYNDSGFDETIKTEATTAVFEGIDHTKAYTVEVTAANMTVSTRTYIGANSATVTGFTAHSDKPGELILTWETKHPLAEGNWILLYSADNLDLHEISGTAENEVVIKNVIPNANYHFTLMTSTGSYVFNGTYDFFLEETPKFYNYNVHADKIEFNMVKTPGVVNWDRFDLADEDYKTDFAVGEKASFLLRVRNQYNPLSDNIVSMFVIRNSADEIIKVATSEQTWVNMWYRGYCELDIPVMPNTAGAYTITVYFNGYYVGQQAFTIS